MHENALYHNISDDIEIFITFHEDRLINDIVLQPVKSPVYSGLKLKVLQFFQFLPTTNTRHVNELVSAVAEGFLERGSVTLNQVWLSLWRSIIESLNRGLEEEYCILHGDRSQASS